MDKNYIIKGKLVGQFVNGMYFTERHSTKHFFIKGQGYPISDDILKDLELRKCGMIIIREFNSKGKKTIYGTELYNYLQADLFKEAGFDYQRCYPLKLMRVLIKPK